MKRVSDKDTPINMHGNKKEVTIKDDLTSESIAVSEHDMNEESLTTAATENDDVVDNTAIDSPKNEANTTEDHTIKSVQPLAENNSVLDILDRPSSEKEKEKENQTTNNDSTNKSHSNDDYQPESHSSFSLPEYSKDSNIDKYDHAQPLSIYRIADIRQERSETHATERAYDHAPNHDDFNKAHDKGFVPTSKTEIIDKEASDTVIIKPHDPTPVPDHPIIDNGGAIIPDPITPPVIIDPTPPIIDDGGAVAPDPITPTPAPTPPPPAPAPVPVPTTPPANAIIVSNAAELTAALKSATGGETILLKSGDYGSWRFNDAVTHQYSSTVTIQSENPDNPAEFKNIHVSNTHNLTFDSIAVDLNQNQVGVMKDGSQQLIRADNTVNLTIQNSFFKGGIINDGGATNGYATGMALKADGVDGLHFLNNEVTNVYKGISMGGPANSIIDGNYIHDIRSDGIYLGGNTNTQITNNIITDLNPYILPGGAADHADLIQIQGFAIGLEITGNYLNANGASAQGIFLPNKSGALRPEESVLIANNLVATEAWNGIYLSNRSNAEILNNVLLDIGTDRSYPSITILGLASNITIENNIAHKIKTQAPADTTLANNIELQNTNPAAANYYDTIFLNVVGNNNAQFSDFLIHAGALDTFSVTPGVDYTAFQQQLVNWGLYSQAEFDQLLNNAGISNPSGVIDNGGGVVVPDPTPVPNVDPNALDDTLSVQQDGSIKTNLLANDTDANGDTLTISNIGNAAHGTITQNPDGTVTYTPNAGFKGNDSFIYSISDGHGGTDTATANVTVSSATPIDPSAKTIQIVISYGQSLSVGAPNNASPAFNNAVLSSNPIYPNNALMLDLYPDGRNKIAVDQVSNFSSLQEHRTESHTSAMINRILTEYEHAGEPLPTLLSLSAGVSGTSVEKLSDVNGNPYQNLLTQITKAVAIAQVQGYTVDPEIVFTWKQGSANSNTGHTNYSDKLNAMMVQLEHDIDTIIGQQSNVLLFNDIGGRRGSAWGNLDSVLNTDDSWLGNENQAEVYLQDNSLVNGPNLDQGAHKDSIGYFVQGDALGLSIANALLGRTTENDIILMSDAKIVNGNQIVVTISGLQGHLVIDTDHEAYYIDNNNVDLGFFAYQLGHSVHPAYLSVVSAQITGANEVTVTMDQDIKGEFYLGIGGASGHIELNHTPLRDSVTTEINNYLNNQDIDTLNSLGGLKSYVPYHYIAVDSTGMTQSPYEIAGAQNPSGFAHHIVSGTNGDDVLYGTSGDDILIGGDGNDVLTGGLGADIFHFDSVIGIDSVLDFNTSEGDIIDISDILSGQSVDSSVIDNFVQLQVIDGTNAKLLIDVDGQGGDFVTVANIQHSSGVMDLQSMVTNGEIVF